jgi:ABC-2 type transport system ATP-binding protein
MANAIVEARELVKKYKNLTAVDRVSFEISEGELFGLLGPNGAGKTTTISIVSCLLEPTEGDVLVDGFSVRNHPNKVKNLLGVVPQEIALYPTLTALENLKFWGRMYGLSEAKLKERIVETLEIAGLTERAKERIETYSGGMKRRINIAAGILHKPKVLLMDEPTVGIDPQSRNHILETVKKLNAAGTTIIYTSHYMEEVELLCDRVGIIDHGKIIAEGSIDELKKLIGSEEAINIQVDGVEEKTLANLQALELVDRVDSSDGKIQVLTKDSEEVLAAVVSALNEAAVHIAAIEVVEPNLESVFLHLTGKSLRD